METLKKPRIAPGFRSRSKRSFFAFHKVILLFYKYLSPATQAIPSHITPFERILAQPSPNSVLALFAPGLKAPYICQDKHRSDIIGSLPIFFRCCTSTMNGERYSCRSVKSVPVSDEADDHELRSKGVQRKRKDARAPAGPMPGPAAFSCSPSDCPFPSNVYQSRYGSSPSDSPSPSQSPLFQGASSPTEHYPQLPNSPDSPTAWDNAPHYSNDKSPRSSIYQSGYENVLRPVQYYSAKPICPSLPVANMLGPRMGSHRIELDLVANISMTIPPLRGTPVPSINSHHTAA